jgi:hypothetical protein
MIGENLKKRGSKREGSSLAVYSWNMIIVTGKGELFHDPGKRYAYSEQVVLS